MTRVVKKILTSLSNFSSFLVYLTVEMILTISTPLAGQEKHRSDCLGQVNSVIGQVKTD